MTDFLHGLAVVTFSDELQCEWNASMQFSTYILSVSLYNSIYKMLINTEHCPKHMLKQNMDHDIDRQCDLELNKSSPIYSYNKSCL